MAGLIDGAAERSKSASRFSLGNRASWTRRWRRRSVLSSISVARTSAKKGQVARPGASGGFGEPYGLGADGREVQLSRRRPDGRLGSGIGHLGHDDSLPSSSSYWATEGSGRSY